MMTVKKAFTLLELLVCIMIIALVSGLVGIRVYDLLDDHRFKSSVEDLYTHIKQLQVLALTYHCDVEIEIFKSGSSFFYECRTDAPLKENVFFKKRRLPGVESITYENKPIAKMDCQIYSSGQVSPPVLLGFQRKNEKNSLWLDLSRPFCITLDQKPKASPF